MGNVSLITVCRNVKLDGMLRAADIVSAAVSLNVSTG